MSEDGATPPQDYESIAKSDVPCNKRGRTIDSDDDEDYCVYTGTNLKRS